MPLDPLDIASPVPADICADTAVHVVADRSAGLRSILAGLRAHHEYVVTLITELLIVLSQLFVYRTAAHLFGTTGFSEVALARRSVNLIQPIVLLGLTVALPRYIAFASGRGETLAIKRFFGATLRCMLISLLLALVLIFTFRNWVAFLLFGSSAYQFLVPPIMLMLAGVVLHGTAYGYFRGSLQMGRANWLNLVNLGVVPAAVFLVLTRSVATALTALGAAWACIAILALVATPWRFIASHGTGETTELMRYGLPRVPGDFIQMALLTLPATFLAHVRGVQAAGFLAFGTSALTMAGAAFGPVSLVLLPKAARMIVEEDHSVLRAHVIGILKLASLFSIGATVLVEALAGPLLNIYIGPEFAPILHTIRVVALAIVPFGLYCVLRGLIDAFHRRAVNTVNNGIALAAFLLLSAGIAVLHAWHLFVWAFVVAIYVLGVLTLRETWKIITPVVTNC